MTRRLLDPCVGGAVDIARKQLKGLLGHYGRHLGPLEMEQDKKLQFVFSEDFSHSRELFLDNRPFAEVLQELNSLCEDLSKFYIYGSEVIICLRGRMFCDLQGHQDEEVDRREQGLTKIWETQVFPHLRFFKIDEMYPQLSPSGLRQLLTEVYGEEGESEIQRRTSAWEKLLESHFPDGIPWSMRGESS